MNLDNTSAVWLLLDRIYNKLPRNCTSTRVVLLVILRRQDMASSNCNLITTVSASVNPRVGSRSARVVSGVKGRVIRLS